MEQRVRVPSYVSLPPMEPELVLTKDLGTPARLPEIVSSCDPHALRVSHIQKPQSPVNAPLRLFPDTLVDSDGFQCPFIACLSH